MLDVEKVICYKIDGINENFFDYFDDYLLCLPELYNSNLIKLFNFSVNNYFNDKHNIDNYFIKNYTLEKLKIIIGDEYELLNLNGNVIDCIAVINKNTRKCGFVNLNGDIVIPCIYDYVTDFNDGLAKVVLNGKICFINKENNIIHNPKYNQSKYFTEISLNNVSLYYPKHIRRFEFLKSLSHPEACKKFNAWSYCLKTDDILLAKEYYYQFLIKDNEKTIAVINDSERNNLIKKLKNI